MDVDSENFNSSQRINLSSMGLSMFPEDLFNKKYLTNIKACDNIIKEIPSNLFESLQNLKWLDLRNNKIKEIPKEISLAKNLEHLLLSGNEIVKIPFEIAQLENLKSLHLMDNPLEFPEPDIVRRGLHTIKEYLKNNNYRLECDSNKISSTVIVKSSSKALLKREFNKGDSPKSNSQFNDDENKFEVYLSNKDGTNQNSLQITQRKDIQSIQLLSKSDCSKNIPSPKILSKYYIKAKKDYFAFRKDPSLRSRSLSRMSSMPLQSDRHDNLIRRDLSPISLEKISKKQSEDLELKMRKKARIQQAACIQILKDAQVTEKWKENYKKDQRKNEMKWENLSSEIIKREEFKRIRDAPYTVDDNEIPLKTKADLNAMKTTSALSNKPKPINMDTQKAFKIAEYNLQKDEKLFEKIKEHRDGLVIKSKLRSKSLNNPASVEHQAEVLRQAENDLKVLRVLRRALMDSAGKLFQF